MRDEKVYPFSNGSQYADWQDRNCVRCTKYNPEKFDGQCDLDEALGEAYMGYGWVTPEVAVRLGYVAGTAWVEREDGSRGVYYGWDCPERILR